MKLRITVLAAALGLLVASSAHASVDYLLTMGDLPFQPVHGLVHPTGVQFGFTIGGVASTDANYNSGGPGFTTFVQDPSIEGDTAGVLSVVFPVPTPIIRFGAARADQTALPVGAIVELFNSANASLGVTNLPMALLVSFPEAQFNYSGPGVKRMTVNFATTTSPSRFAFDNLLFRVPEPTTALMFFVAGTFAMAGPLRRSRDSRRYST